MNRLTIGLMAFGVLATATPAFADHYRWDGNSGWDGYQNRVIYNNSNSGWDGYQNRVIQNRVIYTRPSSQSYYNSYPYGYSSGYGTYEYQRPSKLRNFINRILNY